MKDTIREGILAGLIGTFGDMAIHVPAYYILGTSTSAHYISQLGACGFYCTPGIRNSCSILFG